MTAVTTRFKDSKLSHDWFEKLMRDNPVQQIMDQKTGQPTGNYLTGPVRLSWCETLYKPKPNDAGQERYSTAILWPFGADLSQLVAAVTQCAMANFPENMINGQFNWAGLGSPFHDQAEKAHKYEGYMPGAYYANIGSQFEPRVVDSRMNDIVDKKARIFPGALAMASVNAYHYKNKKRGISLGIQSIVMVCDDKNIGGGKGGNPNRDFAGIQVTQDTNISAAFSSSPLAAPPMVPGQMSQAELMRSMGLA